MNNDWLSRISSKSSSLPGIDLASFSGESKPVPSDPTPRVAEETVDTEPSPDIPVSANQPEDLAITEPIGSESEPLPIPDASGADNSSLEVSSAPPAGDVQLSLAATPVAESADLPVSDVSISEPSAPSVDDLAIPDRPTVDQGPTEEFYRPATSGTPRLGSVRQPSGADFGDLPNGFIPVDAGDGFMIHQWAENPPDLLGETGPDVAGIVQQGFDSVRDAIAARMQQSLEEQAILASMRENDFG